MQKNAPRGRIRPARGLIAAAVGTLALVVVSASAMAAVLDALVRELRTLLPRGAVQLEVAPALREQSEPPTARRSRAAPTPAAPVAVPEREPTLVEQLVERVCVPATSHACAARTQCGCVARAPGCEDDFLASCTFWIASEFQDRDTAHERDPDEPHAELDEAGIAACVRSFEGLPSSCELDTFLDCSVLVHAPTEVGEICAPGERRCRGGVCVRRYTLRAPMEPICRATAREGEDGSHTECAAGLFRGGDGICVRLPRPGERCVESVDGLSCVAGRYRERTRRGDRCRDYDDCPLGLRCTAGRCAPGPTWCESDASCGFGHSCVGPVTTACVPRGTARRAVSSCADGRSCGRGERCIERTEGRCELALCDVSLLRNVFFDTAVELTDPFAGLDL